MTKQDQGTPSKDAKNVDAKKKDSKEEDKNSGGAALTE